MNKNYHTFVLSIFIQIAIVFWGLTFVRRIFILLVEERWIPIFSSTLITGTVVILVISLALARWYRVEISDETIKGPNFWGGFTKIPFSEGISYKSVGIPGFRYLKIHGVSKEVIWVTLPVNDQSELFLQLSKNNEKST